MAAETETQVVNIRVFELRKMGHSSLEEWLADPNHVYIGRANPYVKGASQSKWANPFTVKKYPHKDDRIKMYEEHITSDRHLMAALHELEGKTLGCWCVTQSHVMATYYKDWFPSTVNKKSLTILNPNCVDNCRPGIKSASKQ